MRLLEKIQSISRWRRGDERAPHKPLMLLYALSEYKKGHERLFHYAQEVDEPVKALLMQYGPARSFYNPHYPFWRLANEVDPFWEIENGDKCQLSSSGDPRKKDLIEYDVKAGFDAASYQSLLSNPRLIDEIASKLIQDNFPRITTKRVVCAF
uniref:hypothetical protein n=1 Tax=Thaumasiovibrio occultus TaxID=1891184 RepID=UPI0018652F8E|nr:hypothetical protein [Thaumasiovibrio occultus]